MAQTVGPVGAMVPTSVPCAPITSTAPSNNPVIQGPAFNKVFVQRDYSEGTAVKFHTRLPSELDGLVCIYASLYIYHPSFNIVYFDILFI